MAHEVLSIPDLQFSLKRDPETYKPDFQRYFAQYKSLEQSFVCAPSQDIPKLTELLLFISQVIQLYPDDIEEFTTNVIETLLSRSFGMHQEMRQAFMKAFMRLKTKDFISLNQAVDVAFKLHRCQDKQSRQAMRIFLVNDIKRLNRRQKKSKQNISIQAFLAKTIRDNNATVAREATLLLIVLFKKGVWRDSRTANLIADACLAKRKKVYTPAVRFFIGQEKNAEEVDSDSDSDVEVNKETKIRQLKLGHRVGCKTKNREKRLERSIKRVNKTDSRKANKGTNTHSFLAINLLHDSQTFAERLFRKLERCADRFEIRLLLLDLITRLVALHKLQVLNLYPFLQRFLRPHQRDVTRLLLFAAQASHDEVPPDVMEAVVRTIADNFITERASSEAIAVGLNAVREICARCPYAVTTDLLSDLVLYRTYKNKNVVAAARSLIRLFRVLNPSVLPRKERGRPTEAQMEILTAADIVNNPASTAVGLPALSFGQSSTAFCVPGAEALVLAETMVAEKRDTEKASVGDEDDDLWHSRSDGEGCEEQYEDGDAVEDNEVQQTYSDKAPGCSQFQDASKRKSEFSEHCGTPEASTCSGEEFTTAIPDNPDSTLAKMKKDPSMLVNKAIEVASSRIFTQEEFEAMRKFQIKKQKRFAAGNGKHHLAEADTDHFFTKTTSDNDDGAGEPDSPGEDHRMVNISAITRLVKKPRQSKADRMEAIQDGRVGRKTYSYKVNRMNPHASTTNREKGKRKAFPMIKHKLKQKSKRSFRDKQLALRDQLKRQLKHMR